MTSKENTIQEKEPKNKENMINLGESDSKKLDESKHRSPCIKGNHAKEKEKTKIKNAILKKINNDVEIVEEKKTVKVKDLIDNKYINEYQPEMQDNIKNPKLKFFIDCESCSESEQDLSSASISNESMDNNKKENSKEILEKYNCEASFIQSKK